MQVFGGYGYTSEYPMEQITRDCKICSIYEGSNGIQAMDFLGRKLMMNKGACLDSLIEEIKKICEKAEASSNLKELSKKVSKAADLFYEKARNTAKATRSSEFKSAFALSHPLLMASGDLIMAWMLLWRAACAAPALKKLAGDKNISDIIEKNKNAAFYHGKIMAAQFFINTILPGTMGQLNAIEPKEHPAVIIHENSF